MTRRRYDEEYCPLYTMVLRSRKTHQSFKSRMPEIPRFNCTQITDAYWKNCPVSLVEEELALPGPGVTLLPPQITLPYKGTAYRKIWIESAAPRFVRYVDGRQRPWEWGFNPTRWGALVEWLPLDGPFEYNVVRERIKHMATQDTAEAERLLHVAHQGAWMFELYLAVYFSRSDFHFPYVVCTLALDKQGKPLILPEGGWFWTVEVDTTVVEELGADEGAMIDAAEAFYDPLFHAINRTRLKVGEFQ